MMEGARVLVTGGAGYVGSRLVAYLLTRGAHVTAYDSLAYGAAGLLPFVGENSFCFIQGDIRDAAALRSAMCSADVVVHLAAVVGEPACAHDATTAEQINRDAAITAMNLADELSVDRFIFFSTCSNYGAASAGVLVDETAPLDPRSIYARTKVAAEWAVLSEERRSATTTLRFATICGLSGRMRFDLLVNDMARAAALGRPLEVYRPQTWRPYLHIADVGPVVEQVATAPKSSVSQRVFNVVADNYQKSGLVALVRRYFPSAAVAVRDGQTDDRDYRVSAERLRNELGFTPSHTAEDAFVEVAQAVKAGAFIDPLWPGFSALPLEAASHG